MIIIIVIVSVLILTVLGWVFWNNFVNKPQTSATISNFDQCKAEAGSKILTTFPEQCVTSDGRTFTATTNTPSDEVATKTYCTEAEKLCFEYADTWTIAKLPVNGALPGSKSDLLEVRAPNNQLILTLESGIGGIGGSCDDPYKVTVNVLEATPVASMSGYKDAYSIDMLQVARVVYPDSGKFTAAIYVTDSSEYSTVGTLNTCGIGFSQFINGKNSILSPDFAGAGAFTFGYGGHAGGATYDSAAAAKDAFNSDLYKQAASILASLHYQ